MNNLKEKTYKNDLVGIYKMIIRNVMTYFPRFSRNFTAKRQIYLRTQNLCTHVKAYHDSGISLVDASYYLGKGIILYTMFYCGLNYFMYKSMREEYEKENDDADSKTNKSSSSNKKK